MGLCLLVVHFLANREIDGIWGKTFERNSSTIIHKTLLPNETGKRVQVAFQTKFFTLLIIDDDKID